MRFGSPFQITQIRAALGFRDSRPRSRDNPLQNASHKESLDYKGFNG
jgi:hypothetical protein